MLSSTTRIKRPAADVFEYATDPARFWEWQHSATRGHYEGEPRLGGTCVDVRRVMGGQRESRAEISEYDPPTRWATRGLDGPIRANVGVTVEPLSSDESRVTIELDFVGVGVGRLLAPMVVWRARQEMPQNMAQLKRRLESGDQQLSGEP